MRTVFPVYLLTCDLKGLKPFLNLTYLGGEKKNKNIAQHNAQQFLVVVPTSAAPDYRLFLKKS